MRAAFVGKGGSGKTTLSALFSRQLAHSGAPVVAIDGDINQHLAHALGLGDGETFAAPPLSARLGEIKTHLRGSNPRITSSEAMIKTTPPGRGSRLLRLLGDDPVYTPHLQRVGGVPLMVTGAWVRAQEQGRPQGDLEPHNIHALRRMRTALDARTKDWTAFQEHAVAFHLRNAAAWADRATGADLSVQIDPGFRHGPTALERSAD